MRPVHRADAQWPGFPVSWADFKGVLAPGMTPPTPLVFSELRQFRGLSDFPTDTWGHSQASVSRGSDCSDQLPSLPLPAGQLGVWEHSLNSQNDVVVCGACCSWNLFFFQNLACVRPDEQHPCIDGLSVFFQLFASPLPPPTPSLASSCLCSFLHRWSQRMLPR